MLIHQKKIPTPWCCEAASFWDFKMGLFTQEDKQGTQANSDFLVGCLLFVVNTYKHTYKREQSNRRISFFNPFPGLYVACAPKALFLSLSLDCVSNKFSSPEENKRTDEIGPVWKRQAEILKQTPVGRILLVQFCLERDSRGTWKLHGESIATIVVSTTRKNAAEILFTFWVFHWGNHATFHHP